MQFKIITIFPEMFCSITKYGIISKAIKNKIIQVDYINPRNFAKNKYKSIDNRPYGGGPGMIMSFDPLYLSIKYAKNNFYKPTVIYLSPQGKKIQQNNLSEFIKKKI